MAESKREGTKRQRESEIIRCAEELFARQGYARTSMDEVSRSCGHTKRTVYRYFSCKADLYFAVLLKGYVRLAMYLRGRYRRGGSGSQKAALLCEAFGDFYDQCPEFFRLMAELRGAAADGEGGQGMPYRDRYAGFLLSHRQELVRVCREGQEDGSIRADVDPEELAGSAIYLFAGLFHLLTLSGGVPQGLGLESGRLIQAASRRMLELLRRPAEQET